MSNVNYQAIPENPQDFNPQGSQAAAIQSIGGSSAAILEEDTPDLGTNQKPMISLQNSVGVTGDGSGGGNLFASEEIGNAENKQLFTGLMKLDDQQALTDDPTLLSANGQIMTLETDNYFSPQNFDSLTITFICIVFAIVELVVTLQLMLNFELKEYPLPMMILLNTFFGILFAFKLYDYWYNGCNGYTLIMNKNSDRLTLIHKRPCRRTYKFDKPLKSYVDVVASAVAKRHFIVLADKDLGKLKIDVSNEYEKKKFVKNINQFLFKGEAKQGQGHLVEIEQNKQKLKLTWIQLIICYFFFFAYTAAVVCGSYFPFLSGYSKLEWQK